MFTQNREGSILRILSIHNQTLSQNIIIFGLGPFGRNVETNKKKKVFSGQVLRHEIPSNEWSPTHYSKAKPRCRTQVWHMNRQKNRHKEMAEQTIP